MRYQTSFEKNPRRKQVFTKPSLTVPSMTLSLKELLERHSMGNSVTQLVGQYYGEDDEVMEQVRKMDAVQKLEFAREVRQKIETRKEEIKAAQAARLEDLKKQELEAAKPSQNESAG